ncbi:hypothetical protein BMR1_03g00065 [Babesia microti strain RI]|uniref:Uncharacterized protein n=1 Tax=Babesia microti (strain RI) TaxID=1133968 RepID=A0A0K3APQ0_BABMR|nr:hypothetical protein BMR1_03g00065 [Babesia microti strain RI]CTQ40613.1 hypothetical protein BMR1_03g00065 [Babesia microti strain RI]|eukprot:XP_012648624.1 hypothetical protein BMR1_03g00065 [Babesia microti strain RI]
MDDKCLYIERIKKGLSSIDWMNTLLLVVVAFFTMFTSSFYDNWSSLATFFLMGDVYSNYCSPDQLKGPPLPGGRCNQQGYMVSQLLPVTRFTHYVSSAIAGIILDKYGHFTTATTGMGCAFMCWLLLGFFAHINCCVVLSCILMAMSVDSTAFPALMIKQKFPNSRNVVMAIIGSASSISSAIPIIFNVILEKTNSSFKGISLTYCFLFVIITWVVMSIIHLKFIDASQSQDDDSLSSERDTQQDDDSLSSERDTQQDDDSLSSERDTQQDDDSLSSERNTKALSVWDCLKTMKFVCISFYFTVMNLTLTYHQYFLSVEYKSNSTTVRILEIFFIVSFFPCIMFGIIIEKYGICITLPLLNLFGLFAPIFALHTNTVNGILMSLCIMMIYSVFATTVFCYVQHAFPKHKFGAISGIVSTIGGCASMACMPLFRLCNTYGFNYQVNIMMVLLRIANFAPLWYIYKHDHTRKLSSI